MSGGTMARTGLRMMPTSPSPPLKFRTAGFPQYGFKAGLSGRAFPSDESFGLHLPFVLPTWPFLPAQCRGTPTSHQHRRSSGCSLYPRGPRSGSGCSVPIRPRLIDPIRPTPWTARLRRGCGLYALPSPKEWFRAFVDRSFLACRSLRPRRVRRRYCTQRLRRRQRPSST